MKENIYDQPEFFAAYSQMDRSRRGLEAAGEWETLAAMLPDCAGLDVLDLGCGYGWHCRYAAEHGARSVLGTDLSARMLAEARRRTNPSAITYRRAAMEDLECPDAAFDLVFSSLALHYVADYEALVRKIRRWLRPGGSFVFSAEHPVFTAQGPQDWEYDAQGRIRHFPVDRYFEEGRRTARFLGCGVTKYHRTLTTYLGALLENGFALRAVAEPTPPQRLLDTVPGMADELRRPMMLLVRAEAAGKTAAGACG
ncbi:MAG: class I SAM-dependent methyltransferase [Oscillospiraceae bacterium]|nr:class I SAM-dependent methyltransferase [Oscillospiraceae bacterium]